MIINLRCPQKLIFSRTNKPHCLAGMCVAMHMPWLSL